MKNYYFPVFDTGQLKTSEILDLCEKLFPVYCYNRENVDKEFPLPKKTTLRWFKANIEADEEHKNKSADGLEKEGIVGITLRERLLLELNYYSFTGKHLDIDNITLCAGSRDSDGGVPVVDWRGGRLQVDWYGYVGAGDDLRVREAVSNPFDLNLLPLKDKWIEQGEKEGWISEGKVIK